MPDFTFRDPASGRTVTVRGSSMPTEAELEDIFKALPAQKPSEQPGATGHFIGPRKTESLAAPEVSIGNVARAVIGNVLFGSMAETGKDQVTDPGREAALVGGAMAAGPVAGAAAPVIGRAAEAAAPTIVKMGAKKLIGSVLGWKGVLAKSIFDKVMASAATESAETVAAKAASRAASTRMVEGMSAASKETPEALVAAGKRAIAGDAGATLATAGSARTTGQMSKAWIQSDLMTAAKRANATLTPEQLDVAEHLVREEGLSPVDVVLKMKAATKSPSAAEEFVKRFGTKDDAEMMADLTSRNYKSQSASMRPKR